MSTSGKGLPNMLTPDLTTAATTQATYANDAGTAIQSLTNTTLGQASKELAIR